MLDLNTIKGQENMVLKCLIKDNGRDISKPFGTLSETVICTVSNLLGHDSLKWWYSTVTFYYSLAFDVPGCWAAEEEEPEAQTVTGKL